MKSEKAMTIHATAVIDRAAQLDPSVVVGPYAYIGPGVVIKKGAQIHSHVVITGDTLIGEYTEISPFVCIGQSPQVLGDYGGNGKIIIGKHNLLREYVTIHAGTGKGGGITHLGDHSIIMTNAHIAHDCIVGDHVVMANGVNLGGHVTVGDYAYIGGISGVHPNSRLGRGCIIGGLSGVEGDVIPYGHVTGNRATLKGLNIVGLKRRNVSREVIHALRTAYRLLFANEGTLAERIQDVIGLFATEPHVMEIITFVQENAQPGERRGRPLCLPHYDESPF
jgi:UDP-N-acetylglucosamine acyltransferase